MEIEISTTLREKIEIPGGDYLLVIEVKAKKGSQEKSLGFYDIDWKSDITTEDDVFEKISLIEEECLDKAERAFKGNGKSPEGFFIKYKDKDLNPVAKMARERRKNNEE
jgi:hypothetical protein